MATRKEIKFGEGSIILETGKLAKQASGAIWAQMGDTVVLTTVVAKDEPVEGQDFFPLTVDYREKTYAAGRIPGGYFKREGRPTEREILTSRLIDRPIRPLFPENYMNEVQIISTVVSADGINNPDICAIVGASAALCISDIPFETPIAAVHVGLIDGKYVANPSFEDLKNSKLDLIMAASRENIIMIEAGASEVSEVEMLEAIGFGHKAIQDVIQIQEELRKEVGKPKQKVPKVEFPAEIEKKVAKVVKEKFVSLHGIKVKEERAKLLEKLFDDVLAQFDTKAEDFNKKIVKAIFEKYEYDAVREMILNHNQRPDARSFQEIRDITCEVGILPRAHGSALFTRGQTQSLGTATLGTGRDEQSIESLEGGYTKNFMLHYNFPPFSVGEVGRFSGPGRREIGHGALAERSLSAVMPKDETTWDYSVRVVSEILESNGSSSMATVCSGSLSLMDAGVPITGQVAGIAMGLVKEGDKWAVLTDIAGVEDHLGDMDFKVAGTLKGITALQMDIKISGLSVEIMKKALQDAKEARLKILEIMNAAIEAPRTGLSKYAPQIISFHINPEKIRDVIGPGGKIIKKLIEETGCEIQVENDGKVSVASSSKEKAEIAIEKIKQITAQAEVGRIYQGMVRKIMPFGAFCEILPGTDGLVHVSEIADGFVKRVEDFLKEGDIVKVKVLGIDERGKISLSMKAALKDLKAPESEPAT